MEAAFVFVGDRVTAWALTRVGISMLKNEALFSREWVGGLDHGSPRAVGGIYYAMAF